MQRIYLNGKVILADRQATDCCVTCRDGIIQRVGPKPKRLAKDLEVVDLAGRYLSPGFIDIHVHGGCGSDFMDGTVQDVVTACQAHLSHGVTTIFPTSTTGRPEQIMAMLQAVKKVINAGSYVHGQRLPRIEGVHLYGPFFAPDKVGCHNKQSRREPTADEFRAYFKTKLIRIATCAAELPGAISFYRTAQKHACLITCGHSNSSWAEMAGAFESGMRHVDHFWCAMSSVPSIRARLGFPMQASMMEFVLANPEMSTEVIADGCHLSPELLRFAWQMKSSQRLCLVSDCNRALDMPPGRYAFGDRQDKCWFWNDGNVGRTKTGALASSVRALDSMVRYMTQSTDIALHEVIRMASLTPAERVGIAQRVGSIEQGKHEDLLILNEQLQVETVIVGGQMIGPQATLSAGKLE
jgi:N-acetylglucosamine-6-phosphate deacetylase